MKLIKAAAAALNQTPLAWEENLRHILDTIAAGREQQVTLLCLPELCITGYGCEDAFQSPGVQATAQQILLEILPHTHGMIVSAGLPVLHGGGLFNTAALIADGELLGLVAKQNLPRDGIHYEPRWFRPWPSQRVSETEIGGQTYPLGDLLFNVGGVRIGFEICEDAWVARRPGADLAQRGADVILNPSASHFAFGKQEIRRRFVLEGSRAFGVSYLYANLLGNEAGRIIYDGGTMIASEGRLASIGPRFSFADQCLATALLDIDATRMNRARSGGFRLNLGDEEDDRLTVSAPFSYPPVKAAAAEVTEPDWATGPHVKEEEFTRAVALGLFDYLRKSRSHGFIVSLSGGADSSAVTTLCSLAIRLSVRELGFEGVRHKLGYIRGLDVARSEPEMIRRLVLCVYQATRNSSETTLNAARLTAAAMEAEFMQLDVDGIVQDYIRIVTAAVGRELTWEQDDIALQNIQARVRSPGIWMIANLRGALLLSTSNRSEAAVGYATMDGDTSGGLSPIAGIDKAFLREWLVWMERHGPVGLGPAPELAAVNCQAPTAELRPSEAGQTDESDLMPYPVLDAIERAAIRDKLVPVEVYDVLSARYPQYASQQLLLWIERFFRLWSRNQWKRERYAPSFHVDDENLDPKTWCRFPILSGGFERELEQLRQSLR